MHVCQFLLVIYRLLAHAKAESVKSKVAAEERKLKNKSWFSFRWYVGISQFCILFPLSNWFLFLHFVEWISATFSGLSDMYFHSISLYRWRFTVVLFFCRYADAEDSLSDASEEQQLKEERLTTEEWQAINKLLSFQPEEELILRSAKDAQNMVQFLVTVSIGQAAARIISVNQVELVCGRFEQLDVSTKFRHHSVYCDVLLKFYGLSAPEGSLTQVCFFSLEVA